MKNNITELLDLSKATGLKIEDLENTLVDINLDIKSIYKFYITYGLFPDKMEQNIIRLCGIDTFIDFIREKKTIKQQLKI